MQTLLIRASTPEEPVRGCCDSATRSHLNRLPDETYQLHMHTLRLHDDQHIAYRCATDDKLQANAVRRLP